MKINDNNNYDYDKTSGININDKSETFIYDINSNLDYNELKYYIFTKASLEELNKEYPIKYLKEKDNIYYTIYSIKDNKICYVVFKEIDQKLYIDYSWVYSRDMIDADKILNIQIGTDYTLLDSIDKNIIKIDEMSSAYFTLHFFKDGTSAMLEIGQHGEIYKIIMNDNIIFGFIYETDYPEKIIQ